MYTILYNIYTLYLYMYICIYIYIYIYIYINELGADLFEGKVKVLNQYLSKRVLREQLVVDRIVLRFYLLTRMNILNICKKGT